ncbi:sigma-70 family RNA polymerase sigma factor [Streptomyces sp. ICN988]|uniref:RNA polymerase sigma factor n=1 Tax=unclassified Streptomyces TaxID=2593676 RepID=UPI0021E50306|nr:sigma-70 family RNA polymerase sigma factor [Streptomyces sp. ICN988]MCV2457759.1 sigma-70 family RNA polymerase sigma factor [Streptomyces sp. ICN988]
MQPVPEEEFAQFFAKWEPQVRRFLIWLEGDHSVIDDAAQETMLSAFRYWETVCACENKRAWLFRVAPQRLSDAQEARRKHGMWTDPSEIPDQPNLRDPIALREERLAILDAVRKLPTQQATAIALQIQYDLPLSEIADIMKIDTGTVKSHLHHARTALRQLLGEAEGGECG